VQKKARYQYAFITFLYHLNTTSDGKY